jgi:hypothetical protein
MKKVSILLFVITIVQEVELPKAVAVLDPKRNRLQLSL